jgi:hypothetical protein
MLDSIQKKIQEAEQFREALPEALRNSPEFAAYDSKMNSIWSGILRTAQDMGESIMTFHYELLIPHLQRSNGARPRIPRDSDSYMLEWGKLFVKNLQACKTDANPEKPNPRAVKMTQEQIEQQCILNKTDDNPDGSPEDYTGKIPPSEAALYKWKKVYEETVKQDGNA